MSYIKNYEIKMPKIKTATDELVEKLDDLMDKALTTASAKDIMQMDPEMFVMLQGMLSIFDDAKNIVRQYADWMDQAALIIVMSNYKLDEQNQKLDEILKKLSTEKGA